MIGAVGQAMVAGRPKEQGATLGIGDQIPGWSVVRRLRSETIAPERRPRQEDSAPTARPSIDRIWQGSRVGGPDKTCQKWPELCMTNRHYGGIIEPLRADGGVPGVEEDAISPVSGQRLGAGKGTLLVATQRRNRQWLQHRPACGRIPGVSRRGYGSMQSIARA